MLPGSWLHGSVVRRLELWDLRDGVRSGSNVLLGPLRGVARKGIQMFKTMASWSFVRWGATASLSVVLSAATSRAGSCPSNEFPGCPSANVNGLAGAPCAQTCGNYSLGWPACSSYTAPTNGGGCNTSPNSCCSPTQSECGSPGGPGKDFICCQNPGGSSQNLPWGGSTCYSSADCCLGPCSPSGVCCGLHGEGSCSCSAVGASCTLPAPIAARAIA